ncbi:hypothetical protein M885DRAFT_547053 [Pelagophyceae sp. CCMP2097]|nr:hypothetical protein M885DRAFT_547053 [Pelagophyceae sp. CCMP2097]
MTGIAAVRSMATRGAAGRPVPRFTPAEPRNAVCHGISDSIARRCILRGCSPSC